MKIEEIIKQKSRIILVIIISLTMAVIALGTCSVALGYNLDKKNEMYDELSAKYDEVLVQLVRSSNNTLIKLNKCPLCNSDVKISISNGTGNTYYYIQCDNCKIKTYLFNSVDELKEYWNGN